MITTAYKALIKDPWKRNVSVSTPLVATLGRPKQIGVHYKWEKWNRPRKKANQFLFVFETLDDARSFVSPDTHYPITHYPIYKVRVKNMTSKIPHVIPEAHRKTLPTGTRFCTAVKLVKLIKY